MDLDQVYWIWVYFKIEEMELLVQKESRSTSFGAKVAPSLQRADPSFMCSDTGSIGRAKCSNILHDSGLIFVGKACCYTRLILSWKSLAVTNALSINQQHERLYCTGQVFWELGNYAAIKNLNLSNLSRRGKKIVLSNFPVFVLNRL